MTVRVVQGRNGEGFMLSIGTLHQGTPNGSPQPGAPKQPPSVSVGNGTEVQKIANQLVKGDIDLRLPQLVCVFDPLRLEANGVGPPVEGRPSATGNGGWVAGERPVLVAVIEAVPGRDGVAGEVDLDDAIYDVGASEGCQAGMTQHTLDSRSRGKCRNGVVEDWEDTEHGKRNTNVGDDVCRCCTRVGRHCAE